MHIFAYVGLCFKDKTNSGGIALPLHIESLSCSYNRVLLQSMLTSTLAFFNVFWAIDN